MENSRTMHKAEKKFQETYDYLLENCPEFLRLEGIHPSQTDVRNMSKKYFINNVSMSVDSNANANESISPSNYQSEITKGVLKLEGYSEFYYNLVEYLIAEGFTEDDAFTKADSLFMDIMFGRQYLHDAAGHKLRMPYCFAFSTAFLMAEGRTWGQLFSKPAKKSFSFMNQVIETIMDMANEFAGAVAPADLFVNLAYYVHKDGFDIFGNAKDRKFIEDLLQNFVHIMNNKFTARGESPFTNIPIFDSVKLKSIFSTYRYPNGDAVYYDTVQEIQNIFMNFFSKGDPISGLPYRFPVVTYNTNITSKNIDTADTTELHHFITNNLYPKGVFNIHSSEGHQSAMCCRYINDPSRMKFRTDSFGNGGVNIGSHRIVTLNLPLLAAESLASSENFYDMLTFALNDASVLLMAHRHLLNKLIEKEFLKFFKPLRWFSMQMFFSTFGIIGLNETVFLLTGRNITTPEGQAKAKEILLFIEKMADKYSEKHKVSFNVEQIPGENAAVKLAHKAKILLEQEYSHILTEGVGGKVIGDILSNQIVPLDMEVDWIDRVTTTGDIMQIISGGAIHHDNRQEVFRTPEQMYSLVTEIIKRGVSHFALNYVFGVCKNGHSVMAGNEKNKELICPVCGEAVNDAITRVVGFFTPVKSWNTVRQEQDFPQRAFYCND